MGLFGLLLRIGRMLAPALRWMDPRRGGVVWLWLLWDSLGRLVLRIFTGVGIGLFAYNFAGPVLVNRVAQPLLALPPDLYNFVAMTKLDVAITIVMSAYAARLIDTVRVRRRGQTGGITQGWPQ